MLNQFKLQAQSKEKPAQVDASTIIKQTRISLEANNDKPLTLTAETPRLTIRSVTPEDVSFYQKELWGDGKLWRR